MKNFLPAMTFLFIIGMLSGFTLAIIIGFEVNPKHVYMSSETKDAIEEGISKEFIQVDSITSDYDKIWINLKNNNNELR